MFRYDNNNWFDLKDDPKLAMITEHPSLKSKCQALSKPMALTLCLGDRLSTNQKKSIVQRLYLEHIGRILGSNPRLLDWFTVSTTSERSKNDFQLADLNIDVPLLFSEHAVKKAVRIATSKLDLKHKITSQVLMQLNTAPLGIPAFASMLYIQVHKLFTDMNLYLV